LPDGRVNVYGQPVGGPLGAQRVFLTERRNARGQSLWFTYDTQSRLVAATDALGQVTTLDYEHATDPNSRSPQSTIRSAGAPSSPITRRASSPRSRVILTRSCDP
jgi:YD repeat-containing protein